MIVILLLLILVHITSTNVTGCSKSSEDRLNKKPSVSESMFVRFFQTSEKNKTQPHVPVTCMYFEGSSMLAVLFLCMDS